MSSLNLDSSNQFQEIFGQLQENSWPQDLKDIKDLIECTTQKLHALSLEKMQIQDRETLLSLKKEMNQLDGKLSKVKRASKLPADLVTDWNDLKKLVDEKRKTIGTVLKDQKSESALLPRREVAMFFGTDKANGPVNQSIQEVLSQNIATLFLSHSLFIDLLKDKSKDLNQWVVYQNKSAGYVILLSKIHPSNERYKQELKENSFFNVIDSDQLKNFAENSHLNFSVKPNDFSLASPTAQQLLEAFPNKSCDLTVYLIGHGLPEQQREDEEGKIPSVIAGLKAEEIKKFFESLDVQEHPSLNCVVIESCYSGGKHLELLPSKNLFDKTLSKTIYVVNALSFNPTIKKPTKISDFKNFYKEIEGLLSSPQSFRQQDFRHALSLIGGDNYVNNRPSINFPGFGSFRSVDMGTVFSITNQSLFKQELEKKDNTIVIPSTAQAIEIGTPVISLPLILQHKKTFAPFNLRVQSVQALIPSLILKGIDQAYIEKIEAKEIDFESFCSGVLLGAFSNLRMASPSTFYIRSIEIKNGEKLHKVKVQVSALQNLSPASYEKASDRSFVLYQNAAGQQMLKHENFKAPLADLLQNREAVERLGAIKYDFEEEVQEKFFK